MKISYDASGFVNVSEVLPEVLVELRYYTAYNFIGRRIPGYESPCALLTKEAALVLQKVAARAARDGYSIRIFDAYRPRRSVIYFVDWCGDEKDQVMKPYFYPHTEKSEIIEKDYISPESDHTSGSTLDMTLFNRSNGHNLDMGAPFDHFGERSNRDFTSGLTPEQIRNRHYLYDLMADHGFTGIESEWWHYTLDNEPYGDTWFDFPVNPEVLKK